MSFEIAHLRPLVVNGSAQLRFATTTLIRPAELLLTKLMLNIEQSCDNRPKTAKMFLLQQQHLAMS